MKARTKRLFDVLQESLSSASGDRVPMMGAALAYYMMFSIAPLLVIAIGAAGIVFGKGASARIFAGMSAAIGAQSARTIQSMVSAAAAKPHASAAATVVGVVTLLVGASGVFQQLQQSLNIIWKVAPEPGATWRILVRQRLLSFGMVAVIGLLLLVSLFVSAAISAADVWIGGVVPGVRFLWSAADVLISFGLISGLFAAVLKLLPDVRLAWKDVRGGGAVTALLFVIGKTALGFYLGRSALASSYGAAGSLIVVLLWVFFSSQILFFGAELTRALFLRGGRAAEPKPGARLTVLPFIAATTAPAPAQGRPSFVPEAARGEAREDWLWISGAATAAAALLLLRGRGRWRLTEGFALGVAAGLLALLEFPDLPDGATGSKSKPSAAARLIARIPLKVKIAAVRETVGAGDA